MFHPLKIDFYYKVKEITDFILCESKEQVKSNDTQPVFYIQQEDKRVIFGDIYALDGKIFILRISKLDNSKNFYRYSFSEMYITNQNELKFYDNDFTNDLFFEIINHGNYLGNIYLHKKTIQNLTKEMLKNQEELKILNMDRVTLLKDKTNDFYKYQYNMDLYFEEECFNLIDEHKWSEIYEVKDESFNFPIDFNEYDKLESKTADDIIVQNTGVIDTYKKANKTYHLITGSLFIADYDINKTLKRIKSYDRKLDMERIKKLLVLYKGFFIYINKDGKVRFKSAQANQEINNREQPFISVSYDTYQVISNNTMEIYEDNLLKIL